MLFAQCIYKCYDSNAFIANYASFIMESFTVIFEQLKHHIQKEGNSIIYNDTKKVPISAYLFKPIPEQTEEKKITFIDGGNAELLSGPQFSIGFIRLCATQYEGIKTKNIQKKEFFVLITMTQKEGSLVYQTSSFQNGYTFPDFSAFDPSLTQGNHRATPQAVTDRIRTISELLFMNELSSDILVRDGELRFYSKEENTILDTLLKKNKTIVGIGKTNTLITDTANSATAVLHTLSPKGSWSYLLGKNEKDISSFLVRLHPNSEYIFTCDIGPFDVTIFSSLQTLSKDPLFLGYPYGLLAADQYARVSNQEKEMLMIQFLATAGKDAALLKPYLRAQDAHGVLDTIK